MSGHTQGPWSLDGTSVVNPAGDTPDGTYWIAHAHGKTRAEREANARLLAAAPNLLELATLLERILAYEIKRYEALGDDEGARLKSFTLAEVRAIISKAEGRDA